MILFHQQISADILVPKIQPSFLEDISHTTSKHAYSLTNATECRWVLCTRWESGTTQGRIWCLAPSARRLFNSRMDSSMPW